MVRWQSWFAAMVVAVAAMVGTPAFAQNLVTNPGFETGSFSGWTVDPIQNGNTVSTVVTSTPHSGTYKAQLGSFQNFQGISQNITTQVGRTYTFSFYYRGVGSDGAGNQFRASFDGQQVFSSAAVSNNGGAYFFQTLSRVATSTTTAIRFEAFNDGGSISLDDVSVAAAPEVSTWAMMIVGFGLIGAALRRRRRNAGAQARGTLLLV